MPLPMAKDETTLPPSEALPLRELIAFTPHGIASRVLARTPAANVTLFAFDRGQGLTEHTSPYDALVVVLEGGLVLTIGGEPVKAPAGSVTRMPAAVPHALEAEDRTLMLLLMLRSDAARGALVDRDGAVLHVGFQPRGALHP